MQVSGAYMAGLADSDGSFTITIRHKNRPSPNYCAFFQIGWLATPNSIKVLNAIKAKYGGAVYFPKPAKAYIGRPQMVKYFALGKALDNILSDVHGHILLKKKQVRLCMFMRKTTSQKYGHGRPKPQNLKDFHHGLYLKMRELNTKNSGDRSSYVCS